MLNFYLFPISYAFLTFPIAALLFTLPFLIVQYRKHGYIHKYRAFILYLFLLYMMNAFYLIILPLPPSIHNAPPNVSSYMQWIPFHFIQDIMRETQVNPGVPATYLHLFKERAFLQVLFNVLITVPFGVFLRYYFRVGWVKCLVLTFCLTLFFEITQVTGIYGIYDYPYRLFDVDDLMTNTVGGMVGFIAAEWASRLPLIPRIDKLDEHVDLSKKRVTYTRRGIALLLDWLIILPVLTVLVVLGFQYSYVTVMILYFLVIPYITNGRTFGKWVVRIRLKGKKERLMLRELVIRYGLLYLFVGGLNVLLISVNTAYFHGLMLVLFAFILFVLDLVFAIHVVRCIFNRDRQLFYEKKSGTGHVIS
ncbi:VanZ family protein [Paenibacillus segetis]|jgi:glycopeptide antibiotics resistance protein/uncharacterized RDD family membrane protein YckC|uniref:Permease n=1 Tax=Paenibacillus segetis TaxID=1325360 RepID=A0ABQ1YNQ2_9BACL|nr:permease [Paenibacillus segetis]